MGLVKITRIKRDQNGKPEKQKAYNTFGDEVKPVTVMEDVLCEIVQWGKTPIQEGDGNWVYYDCVWLRRLDDGTCEWADPGSIVFLDQVKPSGVADDGESQYGNAPKHG